MVSHTTHADGTSSEADGGKGGTLAVSMPTARFARVRGGLAATYLGRFLLCLSGTGLERRFRDESASAPAACTVPAERVSPGPKLDDLQILPPLVTGRALPGNTTC